MRLFVLRDDARRSVFAIVALPPDHVSAGLRATAASTCWRRASTVTRSTIHPRPSLTRRGFTSPSTSPRAAARTSICGELEQEVADSARSWDDRLSDALVELAGSPAGHELAASLLALFPRLLQERARRSTRRCSTSSSSSSWATSGRTSVALQNERHMAEPLTRAQALQDRRQGAADRPPAAARAARADGGRGGADAAPGRRRREPLPARLRRARARRRAARRRRARRRWWPRRSAPFGTAGRGPTGSTGWSSPAASPGGRSPCCAPTASTASCSARSSRAAIRTTAWCGTRSVAAPPGGALRDDVRPGGRIPIERGGPTLPRATPGRSGGGLEPRRRPHPARLPRSDRGDRAHQRLRARRRRPSTSRSSCAAPTSRACPSRCRSGRSSSSHPRWRACTCAVATWPAAASGGQTAWRTTAPRSWG